MTSDEMIRILKEALPGAEVKAQDLTGGGDHWQVSIVSKQFEGLGMVAQHQLVYKALGDRMKKEIHALALSTKSP